MIVGVAALVVGSVIPDPARAIFMIGGGGAFLFGLYHYLQ
jgi:hypothetical protein